jgi:hypothetical protein
VGRLSEKCGSLDISQSYGLPHPVTGIAFLFPSGHIAILTILATRMGEGERSPIEGDDEDARFFSLRAYCSVPLQPKDRLTVRNGSSVDRQHILKCTGVLTSMFASYVTNTVHTIIGREGEP